MHLSPRRVESFEQQAIRLNMTQHENPHRNEATIQSVHGHRGTIGPQANIRTTTLIQTQNYMHTNWTLLDYYPPTTIWALTMIRSNNHYHRDTTHIINTSHEAVAIEVPPKGLVGHEAAATGEDHEGSVVPTAVVVVEVRVR